MTDQEPPAHVTDGPSPQARQQSGEKPFDRKGAQELKAKLETEAHHILAHFNNPSTEAEITRQLPSTTKFNVFRDALKLALLKNVRLAHPNLRGSLYRAINQAAGQGLRPDGKEGALIVRKNKDPATNQWNEEVCWQPMVWGIVKLGRQTGAIRSIRANIVFHNEPFRLIQGDEDRIEHEIIPDISENAYADLADGIDNHGNPLANPDRFFRHVRGAYCVIVPVEGDPIKRYMTRARLISLKQSAKAQYGPWNSRFVDEMILKAVILFTCKWINLDGDTVIAHAFQAALLQDQEIEFDAEPAREAPRLEAPPHKLDAFEQTFGAKHKEMAETRTEPDRTVNSEPRQQKTETKQEPEPEYKPPPSRTVKRTPEGDERARKWAQAIVVEIGFRVTTAELDGIADDPVFSERLDYLRHVDLGLANEVDSVMLKMRQTLKGL